MWTIFVYMNKHRYMIATFSTRTNIKRILASPVFFFPFKYKNKYDLYMYSKKLIIYSYINNIVLKVY
jgi:hypothetical protein